MTRAATLRPLRLPVHDHRLREPTMLDLGDRTSIYQPEQKGLIFPRELQTNDPEAELRDHRKRHLVAACRAFAQ